MAAYPPHRPIRFASDNRRIVAWQRNDAKGQYRLFRNCCAIRYDAAAYRQSARRRGRHTRDSIAARELVHVSRCPKRASGARLLQSLHRPLRNRRDIGRWPIHASRSRSNAPHRRSHLRKGPGCSRAGLPQGPIEATAASNTAERRFRSGMGRNLMGCGARPDRRGYETHRRSAWARSGGLQPIVCFDNRDRRFRTLRPKTDERLWHAEFVVGGRPVRLGTRLCDALRLRRRQCCDQRWRGDGRHRRLRLPYSVGL